MSTAGQHLGIDMANNFMQMTLFSIVADMAAPCCRLRKNGPLGLAVLMFLRSTRGRMGNLLIPSPHLATKSVCEGS